MTRWGKKPPVGTRGHRSVPGFGVGAWLRSVRQGRTVPLDDDFRILDGIGASSPGLRTLFRQAMIRRGLLCQGIFVPSDSHTDGELRVFVDAFGASLDVHTRALTDGWESHLTRALAIPRLI